MSWYDELVKLFTEHLEDAHMDELSIVEERGMLIDHFEYDRYSEGIHSIGCCQYGCGWERTFDIVYYLKMAVNE